MVDRPQRGALTRLRQARRKRARGKIEQESEDLENNTLGGGFLRRTQYTKGLRGTAREEGFGLVQSAPANEEGVFLEPVDLFEGE